MTNATPDPTPEAPATRRQLREAQAPRRSRVPAPAYAPTARERRSLRATLAKKVFSGGALLLAGALAVGMSVPASAFQATGDAQDAAFADLDGQVLAVSDEATAGEVSVDDDYSITTYAERLAERYGKTGGSFSPTRGSIRWPFPYSTSITDGFGPRKAPCRGCSTFHKGIDFTPGEGVPVYAIASGVVESSVISAGGLGNEVHINHTIKGQSVMSVYGHLGMKSSPLKAGDTVNVGDFVGLVGSTGTVTGANMHLEIHVNGVAVNPYAWLVENAN